MQVADLQRRGPQDLFVCAVTVSNDVCQICVARSVYGGSGRLYRHSSEALGGWLCGLRAMERLWHVSKDEESQHSSLAWLMSPLAPGTLSHA